MGRQRRPREKVVSYEAAVAELTSAVLSDDDAPPLRVSFPLYAVQRGLVNTVVASLLRRDAVSVVELPTGCGKTLALLLATRSFQYAVQQLSSAARKALYVPAKAPRAPRPQPRRPENGVDARDSDEDDDSAPEDDDDDADDADRRNAEDAEWTLSLKALGACFASARREPAKKGRLGKRKTEQHLFPQIFYATRTHAQVAQIPGEIQKLRGPAASSFTMNILAGRDRLCINRTVRDSTQVPAEGNNLGEVCDKLVAVNQCPAVSNFISLAQNVALFGCGPQQAEVGEPKPKTWQIEDLVQEGIHREGCPYYAAREMVYDADVNLCTFNYIFDPVIRSETKFERALRHSIVVVDEAHNIASVCQDVLTYEWCAGVLRATLLVDIAPVSSLSRVEAIRVVAADALNRGSPHSVAHDLVSQYRPDRLTVGDADHDGEVQNVLLYPRTFQLPNGWSIVDCMDALLYAASSMAIWADAAVAGSMGPSDRKAQSTEPLLKAWRAGMSHVVKRRLAKATAAGGVVGASSAELEASLFRGVYSLIHCLGVTFNPFDISVFGLSILKRLLVSMRFALLNVTSFVAMIEKRDDDPWAKVTLRCLNPALAFGHLSRTVSCIVLASGTLSPFSSLAKDLGFTMSQGAASTPLSHVTAASLRDLVRLPGAGGKRPSAFPSSSATALIYSGAHVVDLQRQSRLIAVTRTVSGALLRCTHASYGSPDFIRDVAATVLHLLDGVPNGSLVLFPSFATCEKVFAAAEVLQRAPRQSRDVKVSIKVLLCEPRSSTAFPATFERFTSAALGARGAALFAVHRGKVSEGFNFADGMARAVINVGVPFRPIVDPLVVAQREWAGDEWYTDDAVRAVNQGLGRCLRHRDDWGAMILLDDRFDAAGGHDVVSKLSHWARPFLQTAISAVDAGTALSHFCKSHASSASSSRAVATPSLPERSAPQQRPVTERPMGLLLNPYGSAQQKISAAPDARLALVCGLAEDPRSLPLAPAVAAVNIFGKHKSSVLRPTLPSPQPDVIVIDDD